MEETWWENWQAGMEQLTLSLNITHTPKPPPFITLPVSPPPGQGSLNKYLSLKQTGQSKLTTFQLSNKAA